MTAEQLEELLGKVTQGEWRKGTTLNDLDEMATAIMKPLGEVICVVDEDTEENEANGRLIALSPSLARRVLAAEKLVEALGHAELQSVHYGYDNGAGGGNFMYKDSIFVDDFKDALTAYREASK